MKKAFDKAEPMYLEAIKILEESFGQEDVRYVLKGLLIKQPMFTIY